MSGINFHTSVDVEFQDKEPRMKYIVKANSPDDAIDLALKLAEHDGWKRTSTPQVMSTFENAYVGEGRFHFEVSFDIAKNEAGVQSAR